VLAGVVEHVHERIPDGERRAERARVVVVVEDAASTSPKPVAAASDADQEPLHAAREAARIVRLDHPVQVVRLNGVMDQAEARSLGTCRDHVLQHFVLAWSAQTRQPVAKPNGHEQRVTTLVARPRFVRYARSSVGELAARASAKAAAFGEGQEPIRCPVGLPPPSAASALLRFLSHIRSTMSRDAGCATDAENRVQQPRVRMW
jgi:hypothetical protein